MKIRQYNFLFDLYFLFFLLPKYEPTKEDIRELGFVQDAGLCLKGKSLLYKKAPTKIVGALNQLMEK